MGGKLPSHRNNNFSQKGFTLIELLVVLAIIAVLITIALANFGTFGRQVDLDTTTQRVLSTLRLARNQTLASEGESQYGVHFEQAKYVLFKGSDYLTGTDKKEYVLSSTDIGVINLKDGEVDVVFDRVRGTTSQYGYITVRLISDLNRTQTININPLGQVSLDAVVNPKCPGPFCPRISDTRHLHFDLGWSIQSATTLRLIFSDPPNPNVQNDIAMSSYFTGSPPTAFDWSGTVPVNGSDQVLRVHTHLLDATDTTLSVHRDRRYNNKALQIIIIDGGINKDTVSYTDVGDASVGSYGGSMTAE